MRHASRLRFTSPFGTLLQVKKLPLSILHVAKEKKGKKKKINRQEVKRERGTWASW